MPVERRIRDGFRRNAEVLQPDVEAFLATVSRHAKRRATVHRGVVAVAVAAVLIGGMALGAQAIDAIRGLDHDIPAASPAFPAGPPVSPVFPGAASAALEGLWQNGPVTIWFNLGTFQELGGSAMPWAYHGSYQLLGGHTLRLVIRGCAGTYTYRIHRGHLRLQVKHQCSAEAGRNYTRLFASFPFNQVK